MPTPGPPSKFRDRGDRPSVRGCVGQQQDHPLESKVALFGGDPPFERLNVVEPGLGFTQDAEHRARDHEVGASQIARNGDRDLRAPAKAFGHADPQPFDEREVGTVTDRRTRRVEAYRYFETNHGRDLRDQLDGEASYLTPLDPADRRMGYANQATQLTLAEASGKAANKEFAAHPPDELPTAPLAAMDGPVVGWHPTMVQLRAYQPRIWRSPARPGAIGRTELAPPPWVARSSNRRLAAANGSRRAISVR